MMDHNILATVQHCEATCENMVTHILRQCPDLNPRRTQLELLNDCKDICTMMAKFLARESMFARHMAHLCAMICETCGNECAKFPDQHSQNCARVCLNCARTCAQFAMAK
ncbi:four-helix bundle copper-binding protein [Pseudalkalibacillus caeni]|uniref:Four-helix bundle copper-binding protein n=2 Tax=Exobacillus caeni TaxID=2574798 RepID=A0A5R9F4Q6_9BACL|nr:four-helix bundle copper-binding protein [Pseudalkalibacillus caeni]